MSRAARPKAVVGTYDMSSSPFKVPFVRKERLLMPLMVGGDDTVAKGEAGEYVTRFLTNGPTQFRLANSEGKPKDPWGTSMELSWNLPASANPIAVADNGPKRSFFVSLKGNWHVSYKNIGTN